MGNAWLWVGCIITGYRYDLIKHFSVASQKAVSKYFSAILLLCLIWGFVGYEFTTHYITKKDGQFDFAAGIVSLIMVFVVIQIERQVILSRNINNFAKTLRIVIGVVMAFIGAIIIDQVLFAKDIQNADLDFIYKEVDSVLYPQQVAIIEARVKETISQDTAWLKEKEALQKDVNQRPMISQPTTTKFEKTVPKRIVTGGKDTTIYLPEKTEIVTLNSIANPGFKRLAELDTFLIGNRKKVDALYAEKQTIRDKLIDDLKKNRGFYEEISALWFILLHKGFPKALLIWLLFFTFFLCLEMFVLVNKYAEKENDYEIAIANQMQLRIDQINALKNNDSSFPR